MHVIYVLLVITSHSQGIPDNFSLRSLSMARCGICDGGACALADSLRYHSMLRSLVLTENEFGDTGE